MSKQRADLGFGDQLDDFDPSEWQPAKPAGKSKPIKEETLKVAAVSGFKSREAKTESTGGAGEQAPSLPPRRRRTGRNAQFNLKARPETIEAYCAIADAQGWGLGETLERAVELLEEKFARR